MNEFREADYEANVNFAPGNLLRWVVRRLAQAVDRKMNKVLDEQTKQQLATEIILLTHNEPLHDVNMLWHPS